MLNKLIVNPGFHKQFNLNRFSEDEKSVLRKFSRDWYLTSSGENIQVAQSNYNYFLMKPTTQFSEMFNIEREVVCIFSDYETFEPRSLDIFDKVFKKLPKMRSETVCGILVSRCEDVEEKVDALLKADPEYPIIVPFTYNIIKRDYKKELVENKFRKSFYSRDLFSFLSPLKKDIYFFGRNNLINELANRHKSGEHSSLFGLRKSGKTSIVYALQRKLELDESQSISFDCELPSIHKLRWNELLESIVREYHKTKESKVKVSYDSRYDEKNAASSFEEDICKIYESKKRVSCLFIFDEIERLTPGTGSSNHWRNGEDFIYFWQTLRGFYQKHPHIFTYMLVGTNPTCVESTSLVGHENPIFASINSQYVPNFTLEHVDEMVTKLGSYMGLEFDNHISAKLFEDFGGHPFLIRQMCSVINKFSSKQRPVKIDKSIYSKALEEFLTATQSHEYLEMMVSVLNDWYPDEYEMLTFLANDDLETFEEFAVDHVNFTRHLIGYGLVNKGQEGHHFNLEIIANHLKRKHKNERLNLTTDEKVEEVSSRRNRLERGLRVLIKNSLRTSHGIKKAREKVDQALPTQRRDRFKELDLNQILDKYKSPLFFLEISNIIKKNWDCFQNVFEFEKDKFIFMLEDINTIGRPDAHAKSISNDDFTQLRLYFKKIEPVLDDWGV